MINETNETKEMLQIEPCPDCGVYPDVLSMHKEKSGLYRIWMACDWHDPDTTCAYLNPTSEKGLKLHDCISEWNELVKQEKIKRDREISEESWKEKTHEEYLEARAAFIRYRQSSSQEAQECVEKFFNISSGETDDK